MLESRENSQSRPVGFEPTIFSLVLLNSCTFTTTAIWNVINYHAGNVDVVQQRSSTLLSTNPSNMFHVQNSEVAKSRKNT